MIIRPEAERDIVEAVDWYENRRAGLGNQLRIGLERVFDQIETMPEVHRVVFRDVRRALIKRFPFAVYYRVEDGTVVVLAVMHSRRDPGRWKSRF